MKKLLLLLFIPIVCFSQISSKKGYGQKKVSKKVITNGEFNGYKYVYVPTLKYEDGTFDKWSVSSITRSFFKDKGFIVFNENSVDLYNQVYKKNPCEILSIGITHTNITIGTNTVTYTLYNCNGELFKFWGSASAMSVAQDFRNASNKALKWFLKNKLGVYSFNPELTPDYVSFAEIYNNDKIDFGDEDSIRKYLSIKKNDNLEGIWNYVSTDASDYKLLIIKDNYSYKACIIEGSGFWKPSEVKATFESTAVDNLFSIKWIMGNKKTEHKSVATLENNALIKFSLPKANSNTNSEVMLYKVFPSSKNTTVANSNDGEGWKGNGSGLIISKSGYIITNYHVIENYNKIEVEFIKDGENKKYNAEVVQSDIINDLSILKIFDMNFDGLDNPPYNFKYRSSDVGTKVYAYGYPMALSLMGKEIKITDGIISSKSGIEGDITKYQISATIQPGSSGGPLFDHRANFIGINSSGLARLGSETTGYTIKSNYVVNLVDALPNSIDLPSSTKLQSLPLTEQIKEISKYVVLIKVK